MVSTSFPVARSVLFHFLYQREEEEYCAQTLRSPKRAKKEARASVPRKPPLVEETADRALQYFRLDRSVVVGQLNSLSRVLSAEALQIEMVAAERVFNKSFSSRLARLALSLQRFAKSSNAMRKEAARQRSPGD